MGDPTVALKIEKLTDSVKVKNANVLSLEDQFTFGVWIQPTTSVHQHQEYFLVIHIANNYALSCGNGCVQVAFRNEKPGWMWKKTGIQLVHNQWTHIAVSYDSVRRQATVMKDGNTLETIPVKGKLAPNVNHLIIKLLRLSASKEDDNPNTVCEDSSFTGMISNLKIWKTVLTEAQIKNQINKPASLMSTEDTQHLVCWWKFDEGYDNKVFDSINNAPEGIVTGCSWWIAKNATGTVQVPASTLFCDLKAMLNNPTSSDIQLAVEKEGPVINAHKIILSTRSEWFKAMLANNMCEANMRTITVKDIAFDTLSLLIEYLYTDSVTIDESNVVDLFIAADKFQVKRLQAICENFLIKNIDEDNIIQVFELADRVNATQLRTFCVNWILSNFGEVLRKGEHLNLSRELQMELNGLAAEQIFAKRRKP
jgi:hypothetical protein